MTSDASVTRTLELVHRAQAGDQDALGELCRRYYPRVAPLVRMRLSRRLRRRVETDDILQETFLTAVGSFDRFEMRTEASLINWLAKIAESKIRDQARRASAGKRDVDREMPLVVKTGTFTVDLSGAREHMDLAVPLDRLIRAEERDLVEECIAELPERYRELILLRHYAGLSFAEIKDETGSPSEGAARMMHAKAMKTLVELVQRRSRTKGPQPPTKD